MCIQRQLTYQFITQQVGKGGNRRNEFLVITHNPIMSMQTCLFEGSLLPESAPVPNTASGEVTEAMNFHSSHKIQS